VSKQKKYAGETSVSLAVFIQDTSSTTGGGLAGVTSASSGLVFEYRRQGQSSWTSVTPVAGKVLGTYLSGGIVADGALSGAYEVDFPDAAFAAGAKAVFLRIRGVTNMLPVLMEIELDAVNYQLDAFGALKPTTAGRTLDVSAGGEAGIDLANVGSPTTTLNLSGTTIKAVTDGVTVSDKTGFKLASDGLAQVTAWTVAITGNITGNVTGSVGSISGVTFPSNFASLSIDANGKVLLQPTQTGVTIPIVTVVQELGSGALAANDLYTPIAQNVWNQLTTATWLANSFGKTVLVSGSTNRVIKVTGSGAGHVAADIHESQANSIHETAFDTSALSARVLATDAVGEIADGVWDEATSGHTTAGTTGKALIDAGSAGNPWTTDLATGYSGTQAGNILNSVKSQTDLIQAGGTVTVSTPVTASGQLTSPLIIGDDYLNANGRAFSWTVPLPSGYAIATASCKFGMRFEDSDGVNSFIATGTVIDAGSGNVTLRFDVPRTTTGDLRPGWYDWSVEIVSASGTEITRVKSGKNAEWQAKQT
jgi:hypothetical protein